MSVLDKTEEEFALNKLEGLGFNANPDILAFLHHNGPKIARKHMSELYVKVHKDYWALSNPKSSEHVEDVKKRMDEEMDRCYCFLVHSGYPEFRLIMDLPLYTEYLIHGLNGQEVDIRDILYKRIRDNADYEKKEVGEILKDVIDHYK